MTAVWAWCDGHPGLVLTGALFAGLMIGGHAAYRIYKAEMKVRRYIAAVNATPAEAVYDWADDPSWLDRPLPPREANVIWADFEKTKP